MIAEKQVRAAAGLPVLLVLLAALGGLAWLIVPFQHSPLVVTVIVVFMVVDVVAMCGLFAVNPNEARVLQLLGRYVGTVRDDGLKWANPFYTKRKVSVRVRNFESSKLKVNDRDGSPIEIGAIVVWRVGRT